MGEHAKVAFLLAGRVRAGPQRGAQQALVPAEGALHLPALAVDPAVPRPAALLAEALDHLPAVLGPGPLAALAAAVDRDDRGADVPVLAAQPVVVLGVVGGVGQHPVPAGVPGGLVDNVGEQRRLVGRADADLGSGQQVTLDVAGDLQEDIAAHGEALGLVAAGVVAGGVAAVQAGAIDGGRGPLADQAAQPGAAERPALELAEPPFLRSRCSA